MTASYQAIKEFFIARFENEPMLVRSPGRINLIGEHTDYNDGFVMPAAIDKEIIFAIAPSGKSVSTIHSLDFKESIELDLKDPKPVASPSWANYLLGIVRQFVDRRFVVAPFNCVFGGNIPVGSGLSSSAALECGFAFCLQQLNAHQIPKPELARMGQWSEHNFVGVRCGIMDQFANMMGKENHVIQLDCRSMMHTYLPINLTQHAIVLFNSGVKHSLASSEYNVRRGECEEGIRVLGKTYSRLKSLRDASMADLESVRTQISDHVFKRCKYIIEEIERVALGGADLQRGDLASFGRRMFETHEGLSKLYQVSCEELDFLVAQVHGKPEVLGARMMGGGFGGCTINLIQQAHVKDVIDSVTSNYERQFGISAEVYTVRITGGTSKISGT